MNTSLLKTLRIPQPFDLPFQYPASHLGYLEDAATIEKVRAARKPWLSDPWLGGVGWELLVSCGIHRLILSMTGDQCSIEPSLVFWQGVGTNYECFLVSRVANCVRIIFNLTNIELVVALWELKHQSKTLGRSSKLYLDTSLPFPSLLTAYWCLLYITPIFHCICTTWVCHTIAQSRPTEHHFTNLHVSLEILSFFSQATNPIAAIAAIVTIYLRSSTNLSRTCLCHVSDARWPRCSWEAIQMDANVKQFNVCGLFVDWGWTATACSMP